MFFKKKNQEAVAIARTFAAMKDYQIDGNKEMIALGTMNVVGSLTSCYIATGTLPKKIKFRCLLFKLTNQKQFLSLTKFYYSFFQSKNKNKNKIYFMIYSIL